MSYRDSEEVKEDEIEEGMDAHEAELDLDEAFDDDAILDDDLLGEEESLEALYDEEDNNEEDFLSSEHRDENY
jgi:hypothetical protein